MTRKCKTSWLDNYMEYTKGQESPAAFHTWTGISMLSAAIGRHVWIPRIKYTIYPNLFVILVATSGKCRKSTGIDIGIELLQNISNPPMIFAQKITVEALIQALELAKIEGASSGLIYAKELSTFMGTDATKGGLIPALTDLYDSPKEWVYHTRGRGKEILRNVTITMIAATTQEWLKMSIPADAVGGGFTSRIVFICRDRPNKPYLFEKEYPEISELKIALIEDLDKIRNTVKGPMDFTPKAMERALEWYEREFYITRDSKVEGYYARKHDTMFKIAAILSIAEEDTRVIDDTHIDRALYILEENEKEMGYLIDKVVATPAGGKTEKIYDIIKKARRISHSDLLGKCWRFATADEVSMMIRTLVEGGQIRDEIEGRNKYYNIK